MKILHWFFHKIGRQKAIEKKSELRFDEVKKYFIKHLQYKGKLKEVKEYRMSDGLQFIIERKDLAMLLFVRVALTDDEIIVDCSKTMNIQFNNKEEEVHRFWAENKKELAEEISKLNALLKSF